VVRIVLQNRHHEHKPSEVSQPNIDPTSRCPPGTPDGLLGEKTAADVEELGSLGGGLNSRIAFSTIIRFAQERAHFRNTRFFLTQSSIPPTKHFSAFSGSPVTRNEG
jgi:hypothetical protein